MKKIFLFSILLLGIVVSKAAQKDSGLTEKKKEVKTLSERVSYTITIDCSNGETRTVTISYDPADPLNTSTMTPDPRGDCPIDPPQEPNPS